MEEGAKEPTVKVKLHPRSNSRPNCCVCSRRRPGYGTLPSRRFEFIPMWGIKVFSLYAPRQVDCTTCGIRVERMPWSEGNTE
jgi:hypothetical protein